MVEMKKVWTRPLTVVQNFEPNEYCASSCGDTEYGVYKFKCDAPGGTLYYYDSNGSERELGGYTPCGKTHEASVLNEFPSGFVDYNRNGQKDDGEEVIVWLQTWYGYIYNYHATTNLDRDSWEVSKS